MAPADAAMTSSAMSPAPDDLGIAQQREQPHIQTKYTQDASRPMKQESPSPAHAPAPSLDAPQLEMAEANKPPEGADVNATNAPGLATAKFAQQPSQPSAQEDHPDPAPEGGVKDTVEPKDEATQSQEEEPKKADVQVSSLGSRPATPPSAANASTALPQEVGDTAIATPAEPSQSRRPSVPLPQTPINNNGASSLGQSNVTDMPNMNFGMEWQLPRNLGPWSLGNRTTINPTNLTMNDNDYDAFGSYEPMTPVAPEPESTLQCLARLRFPDCDFQMTSYTIFIGRNQNIQRILANKPSSKGGVSNERQNMRRIGKSKSYVSTTGGMLGPDDDDDSADGPPPAKKRKTDTHGSSGQSGNEAGAAVNGNGASTNGLDNAEAAAPVDLGKVMPSFDRTEFCYIHSPGETIEEILKKTKGISRRHMKIEYDKKRCIFLATPLHRNGFFCGEKHITKPIILKSGDNLQIKDVIFDFIIPGVGSGKSGEKPPHSTGGKAMKFDFSGRYNQPDTSSDGPTPKDDVKNEVSDVEMEEAEEPDEEEPEEEEDENELDDQDEMDITASDMPMQASPSAPASEIEQLLLMQAGEMPRKRGPGRPPKNGIMSKRQQRELKKHQQEMAKQAQLQQPPIEPPIKRKVGRPRKHPLPEEMGATADKRPYKPRKPEGEGSDVEKRAKEKKDRKVRPPSPPPLREEDYTEEQMAKPSKNYSVLIDEALSAAPDGLTLKQIYRKICEAYPFFAFRCGTKGWESSVRHNLIGNLAFAKDDATGLWSRVPGIELDAGKKRKPTSPDRTINSQYGQYPYSYNNSQQPAAAGYLPGQAALPSVHSYGAQQPGQPGMQQHFDTQGSPQARGTVGAQPPAPAQLPGYGPPPAPARAQVGGIQQSTYSSPYASRPPPAQTTAAPAQAQQQPTTPGTQAARTISAASPALPQVQAVQSAAPTSRTSATPPANPLRRHVIHPSIVSAMVNLKNGLIENLSKASMPSSKMIVMSAVNRVIGLKKTTGSGNEKMEAICIAGLQRVIEGLGQKEGVQTSPIIDANAMKPLSGFKDVTMKTLGGKIGEERAEAVALSAIDRVLGFADASVLPPAPEGSAMSNAGLESLEQNLMKSVRQLLKGMNLILFEEATPEPKQQSPAVARGASKPPQPTSQPTVQQAQKQSTQQQHPQSQAPRQPTPQQHFVRPQIPQHVPAQAPASAQAPAQVTNHSPAQAARQITPQQAAAQMAAVRSAIAQKTTASGARPPLPQGTIPQQSATQQSQQASPPQSTIPQQPTQPVTRPVTASPAPQPAATQQPTQHIQPQQAPQAARAAPPSHTAQPAAPQQAAPKQASPQIPVQAVPRTSPQVAPQPTVPRQASPPQRPAQTMTQQAAPATQSPSPAMAPKQVTPQDVPPTSAPQAATTQQAASVQPAPVQSAPAPTQASSYSPVPKPTMPQLSVQSPVAQPTPSSAGTPTGTPPVQVAPVAQTALSAQPAQQSPPGPQQASPQTQQSVAQPQPASAQGGS